MGKVNPIGRSNEGVYSFISQSTTVPSRSTQNFYHSTVRFGKTEGCGFSSILCAPVNFVYNVFSRIVRFLKEYCCCFCEFTFKKSINWGETKDDFDGIHTAVCISQDHLSSRQKYFTEALKGLSSSALERFREHIGFVLAKRQDPPIEEKAKQIKWYQERRNSINFQEDYFDNIANNEVLKLAVEAFQKEIDEKTQKS